MVFAEEGKLHGSILTTLFNRVHNKEYFEQRLQDQDKLNTSLTVLIKAENLLQLQQLIIQQTNVIFGC